MTTEPKSLTEQLLVKATMAYEFNMLDAAVDAYEKVLNEMYKYPSIKDPIERLMAEFMLCDTLIKTGNEENLWKGLYRANLLEPLLAEGFPAIYYIIAMADFKLYRMSLAEESIDKGLAVLNNPFEPMETGGVLPTNFIQTTQDNLLKLFNDLKKRCTNCPPYATCCLTNCLNAGDDSSICNDIHTGDPRFKGMVIAKCDRNQPCRIYFHVPCWSHYSKMKNAKDDKHMIGVPCLSLRCKISGIHIGKIVKIENITENGFLHVSYRGILSPDESSYKVIVDKPSVSQQPLKVLTGRLSSRNQRNAKSNILDMFRSLNTDNDKFSDEKFSDEEDDFHRQEIKVEDEKREWYERGQVVKVIMLEHITAYLEEHGTVKMTDMQLKWQDLVKTIRRLDLRVSADITLMGLLSDTKRFSIAGDFVKLERGKEEVKPKATYKFYYTSDDSDCSSSDIDSNKRHTEIPCTEASPENTPENEDAAADSCRQVVVDDISYKTEVNVALLGKVVNDDKNLPTINLYEGYPKRAKDDQITNKELSKMKEPINGLKNKQSLMESYFLGLISKKIESIKSVQNDNTNSENNTIASTTEKSNLAEKDTETREREKEIEPKVTSEAKDCDEDKCIQEKATNDEHMLLHNNELRRMKEHYAALERELISTVIEQKYIANKVLISKAITSCQFILDTTGVVNTEMAKVLGSGLMDNTNWIDKRTALEKLSLQNKNAYNNLKVHVEKEPIEKIRSMLKNDLPDCVKSSLISEIERSSYAFHNTIGFIYRKCFSALHYSFQPEPDYEFHRMLFKSIVNIVISSNIPTIMTPSRLKATFADFVRRAPPVPLTEREQEFQDREYELRALDYDLSRPYTGSNLREEVRLPYVSTENWDISDDEVLPSDQKMKTVSATETESDTSEDSTDDESNIFSLDTMPKIIKDNKLTSSSTIKNSREEKLINKVMIIAKDNYKECTEKTLRHKMKKVQKLHNNSLLGMSIKDILRELDILMQDEEDSGESSKENSSETFPKSDFKASVMNGYNHIKDIHTGMKHPFPTRYDPITCRPLYYKMNSKLYQESQAFEKGSKECKGCSKTIKPDQLFRTIAPCGHCLHKKCIKNAGDIKIKCSSCEDYCSKVALLMV